MSEKRELIEGGFLLPNTYVSFGQTVEDAVDVCGKLAREKSYEVCHVDVTPAGASIIGSPERVEIIAAGFEAQVRMPKEQAQIEIEFHSSRSKKEDFWDTARKREKKARW